MLETYVGARKDLNFAPKKAHAYVGRKVRQCTRTLSVGCLEIDGLITIEAFDVFFLNLKKILFHMADEMQFHILMLPKQRYFISVYSSMPYLEPSRPMPDSLTPPNAPSAQLMRPSLIPTIPTSNFLATRKHWLIS